MIDLVFFQKKKLTVLSFSLSIDSIACGNLSCHCLVFVFVSFVSLGHFRFDLAFRQFSLNWGLVLVFWKIMRAKAKGRKNRIRFDYCLSLFVPDLEEK